MKAKSMSRDQLAGFEIVEEAHGWRFGSIPSYPNIVTIECKCGHLSTRDRNKVEGHVCPACGKGNTP